MAKKNDNVTHVSSEEFADLVDEYEKAQKEKNEVEARIKELSEEIKLYSPIDEKTDFKGTWYLMSGNIKVKLKYDQNEPINSTMIEDFCKKHGYQPSDLCSVSYKRASGKFACLTAEEQEAVKSATFPNRAKTGIEIIHLEENR